MDIKTPPPDHILPLTTEELDAVLVGTQLVSALGSLKRNGLEMIREINAREAVPLDEADFGILRGGEVSTSIVLRLVAAAQAAHDELTLAKAGDTVN